MAGTNSFRNAPPMIIDMLNACRNCPLAVNGACPHDETIDQLARAGVTVLIGDCAAGTRARQETANG